MTPEEKEAMPAYLQKRKQLFPSKKDFPENMQFRTMAEWEEVQALLITWAGYSDILTEIVRHAVEECRVIIITDEPDLVEAVLAFEGIPLDNVELLEAPHNSIWIRDYGPWTIYKDDVDSLALADWIYNRPRPKDDVIPGVVAEYLGLTLYEATATPNDLVHTGGNHLRDGMGTAFSSELVLNENPEKTLPDIEQILYDLLGVNRYITLPVLPNDGIHHIDMHMRTIDEETIIVGEYPEGVSDGPQIEANIDYIRTNFATAFGNLYNFIRIPMPPDQLGRYPAQGGYYRTYTNGIFINKTFLMPVYEEQYDTVALNIYRENLPGYKVVGIDCNDIIPSLGAIHCITKLVGTDDPLWIAHPRLRDTYNTTEDYSLQAIIKHASGIQDASLFYRTDTLLPYQQVAMELTDSLEHLWTADIPAQSAGTIVFYYLQGKAHSGKVQVRPLVAPEGYFEFEVKNISTVPDVEFLKSASVICPGETIQFFDDSKEGATSWSWSFPGGEPSVSNQKNPIVLYPTPGIYDIMFIASNLLGSDTAFVEAVIKVEEGVLPFFEGFSEGINESWHVDNPTDDGALWKMTSTTNCYGNGLYVDNFNSDTRGTNDFFRAKFDLSDLEEVQLSFHLAYAPYNENYYDRLKVNVIPCGESKVTVFNKSGMELATTPPTEQQFIPASCEQWREETIDLSEFAGEIVSVEFENVGGWGNVLYIDNIDLSSPQIANQSPHISIVSPLNGQEYVDTIPQLGIELNTWDNDGYVEAVWFSINGETVDLDTFPAFFTDYLVPDYGTYTIRAEAVDNDGASTISSEVTIEVRMSVADKDLSIINTEVETFPNPANSLLHIHFLKPGKGKAFLRLIDACGRVLKEKQTDNNISKLTLNVKEVPIGTYWLEIKKDRKEIITKVLIAH